MSTALTQIQTPRALAAVDENINSINEAIAANISSGGLTEFDLPRVKVSGGSTPNWIVPTLEGEDTQARIEVVVVHHRETRQYYKTAFGKGTGKQPPDCSSIDGLTGVGKPGGDCFTCPLSAFGSADGGAGQACKQVKQLFVLRGEVQLPEVVLIPPTSLKAVRQLFLKLTTQGIPYYAALIALELEKAMNSAGIQYGRVAPKFIRRLTSEEAARSQRYHELCRSLAARVPTGIE